MTDTHNACYPDQAVTPAEKNRMQIEHLRLEKAGLLDPDQPTRWSHYLARQTSANCPNMQLWLHKCEVCVDD